MRRIACWQLWIKKKVWPALLGLLPLRFVVNKRNQTAKGRQIKFFACLWRLATISSGRAFFYHVLPWRLLCALTATIFIFMAFTLNIPAPWPPLISQVRSFRTNNDLIRDAHLGPNLITWNTEVVREFYHDDELFWWLFLEFNCWRVYCVSINHISQ